MITDLLLNNISEGRKGKLWGYSMGLPKLEGIIDGVCKSTYTLLFAGSGVGKSNLMMYAYVYKPLMEHLDDDDFKVTMFALEMKADVILAKLLCIYIYETYGIDLSYKEVYSKKKNYTLSDEHYDIIKECIPWLKKVEEKVIIHDKGANADSIYAVLMEDLKQNGSFTETNSRKIYVPNNLNLTHLVIIDHAGMLRLKDGRSKKQEIDTLSNYLVYLRNICGISPVMIMQSNRDQSSMARRQGGFFLPQMSDVKETNVPYEDSDITIAVYNPNVDKLKTHNGYDMQQLGDSFRSIVCIKNRYGESNVEDCCAFYGHANIWAELPKSDEIFDYELYITPDWTRKTENKDNTEVKEIKPKKSFNFTM